jgi:phosphoesterase RecJ-like protein
MGSTLGLADWLRSQGKTAVVVVPDLYPDFLSWLPGAQESVRADKYPDKAALTIAAADVVLCLDFNTPSRTSSVEQLIREAKGHRVLIDHHLDPETSIFELTFSQPAASSTCELVYTLIEAMHGEAHLTKQGAQCLYCGMMTDTGAFTFNSNRADIFYIISRLLERGIDKDDIYRRVFYNYSEGRLRMMGYALYEKMRLFPEQKTALITLTKAEMKRFRFNKGDTEGFVNLPLQIRNVRFSAFLREDTEKDMIHVSLRSVGQFPCNRFAATYWNGGGHLNAAGGRYNGTLAEAVALFEKALSEFK